jgi:hypothetical protein
LSDSIQFDPAFAKEFILRGRCRLVKIGRTPHIHCRNRALRK